MIVSQMIPVMVSSGDQTGQAYGELASKVTSSKWLRLTNFLALDECCHSFWDSPKVSLSPSIRSIDDRCVQRRASTRHVSMWESKKLASVVEVEER